MNPSDPAKSLVIGTDKKRGLLVFDLEGKVLQELPHGSFNNVDVRKNVPNGAERMDVVLTENRADNTLRLYRINRETLRLEAVPSAPIQSGVVVYGCSLFRPATTGKLYAIVGSKEGVAEQWELVADGNGGFTGVLVRTLQHGGQIEGMVGDDEANALFIGEEMAGIWKWDGDPTKAVAGTIVVPMAPGTPLDKADLEGLSIYRTGPKSGYLLASHQGRYRYLIYNREAPHEFITVFTIGGTETIDGVQETDGLDVTSEPVGPNYPTGMLVVQDGMNPGSTQNFKFVPWTALTAGNAVLQPAP